MAVGRSAGVVIPVSTYRAALNAMPADPALYHVTDRTDVRLGDIVRNSTELQAPLVDVRPDWISRLVLTNSGSVDRGYVIAVQGEAGNMISSANRTGTIKGNTTAEIGRPSCRERVRQYV